MGHPVHPLGFRVGKTLPWIFPSHHYGFDSFQHLALQTTVSRLIRRRFGRFFLLVRSGLVPGTPRFYEKFGRTVVVLPMFNSAYDVFVRRRRDERFKLIRRRRRRSLGWRPFYKGGWKRWKRRHYRMKKVRLYLKRRRVYRVRVRYQGRNATPSFGYVSLYPPSPRRKPRFWWKKKGKHSRHPSRSFSPRKSFVRRKPVSTLRRYGTICFLRDRRAKGRFMRQTRFRFRQRLRIMLHGLSREIRKFWPGPLVLRPVFLHFGNVSAQILASYVTRRFRLGYKINKIVYPLLAEARRSSYFKGLFFKFQGRLTRKARASLNTRVFRYGKIGFSTLDSRVDYTSHSFETRYGTCSVQVWIARRAVPEQRLARRRLLIKLSDRRWLGGLRGRKIVSRQLPRVSFTKDLWTRKEEFLKSRKKKIFTKKKSASRIFLKRRARAILDWQEALERARRMKNNE